ncbi:hypothetical protein [Nocardia flavorosea]|uniref:Uncharacterized protein n=1 Tax=Nocardia flavorosea TaxID=53429 RepID=A0A846YCY1_9NOCA|nr:hypothetical protein [Nocardia flavorosea]NKY54669.1 hypothetical protein [Nocardia flavorosea]
MTKPTPWGASTGHGDEPAGAVRAASTAAQGSTADAHRAEARARRWGERRAAASVVLRGARDRAGELRTAPRLIGKWGYIFAAGGAIITFVLMFQHWIIAQGPDGTAAATPFGKIDSSTRYLSVWSSQGPQPTANLTGWWALLASTAIAVTVAAVAVYIVTDSPKFARIATGASAVSAAFVVMSVLYLAIRQKNLKAMTNRRWDLGGQVGSWINWAFNDGTKPVAGLNQVEYVASGTFTTAAIVAVVLAVSSAVVAIAALPRSTSGSTWIPLRVSITRATTARRTTGSHISPPDAAPDSAATPRPDRPAGADSPTAADTSDNSGPRESGTETSNQ